MPLKKKTKTVKVKPKAKKVKPKDQKTKTVTVVFPRLVLPLPGLPMKFLSKKKKGKKKRRKRKTPTVKINPLTSVLEVEDTRKREVVLHPDIFANIGGVYCLQINDEVQSMINCVIGRDVVIDHHWKYISRGNIIQHIDKYREESPFFPLEEEIKASKTQHILCVYDKNLLADYLFVCVKPFSEYNMYKYAYKVKRKWSKKTKVTLQRDLHHYKSRTAAKIRFIIRRHAEIRALRKKVMMTIFMDKEERNAQERVFTSVEYDELTDGHTCFEPSKKLRSKGIEKYKEKLWTKAYNQQMVPVVKHQSVQTEESVRYNKAVQKDYLFLDKIDYRTTRKVINVLKSGYECLSKSLKEFSTVDVYHNLSDGYKKHYVTRRGKKVLESGRTLFVSSLNMDNWTYIRQSIKCIPNMGVYKMISCVSWHPRYLDLIAIAYQGNCCGLKDDHNVCEVGQILEEIYQPDYVIVLWKLGLDIVPMRIIESNSEIRALQYNVDYPSLLAGANTCGQILLWDMNIPYIPEHPFLKKMSRDFGDTLVPWTYIPPKTTHPVIESSEVFSHADIVYDLQWLPSNSKILSDGTTDVSGKVRSGQIVTASEDGTVGLWSLQSPHPVLRTIKKKILRVSRITPDVPGFMQYDRHMKPDVKYVVAWMGGEAVPVRSVSINNVRQALVPGRLRTNYFSYKSMRNATKMIRPMMHSNITAGLCDGGVYNINPRHKQELKCRVIPVEHLVKDRNWEPIIDAKIQSYCFRHEGAVVCLRRCHYADDMILSVSASSFCVWKEQSKIYNERKKQMPWLKSWYSETVHDVGPEIVTFPVFWKRNSDQNVVYLTGDWSTHRAAMIYLVRKDGYVEIWDLREQENHPYMTMKVGLHTIHHTYPLIFSKEQEQIAFIEDFFMYIIKIPDSWKSSDLRGNKYLQRTGSHEAWRRSTYYAWNKLYDEVHEKEIEEKIRRFHGAYETRRLERLTREFHRVRYRKAKRIKARDKLITWVDKYPFRWWQREKRIHFAYYLRKKGMPLKWTVIEEREPLLVYLKTYTDHTLPKMEVKLTDFIYFDWKTKVEYREFFQLYWDIRYRQVYEYQKLYVEHGDEDKGIVEDALLMHLEEKETTVERKREYGLCYKFQDCYRARRLDDMYKRNIAIFLFFAETQVKLRSRTKFYLENNYFYRTNYLNKRSERVHQFLEGWKPYMNKTLDLWSLYGLKPGPHPTRRVPVDHLYVDDPILLFYHWPY